MKFSELLDSVSPESLPELNEKRMPEASAKRVERLDRERSGVKPKKRFWQKLTPFVAAAAAICGLVVGLRVATLPDRNVAAPGSETPGSAVSGGNPTVIEPAPALETSVALKKVFSDGEFCTLRFRVSCPGAAYRLIMHGGMKLKEGDSTAWMSNGCDINDPRAIELAILAGDVLKVVEPGDTEFEFDIKVHRTGLPGGTYTLTIDSLYSAGIEYDSDDNPKVYADPISGAMTLTFELDIKSIAGKQVTLENGATVTLGNDELGKFDLRVDEAIASPLSLTMSFSAWGADDSGLLTGEKYFFSDDHANRYFFWVEYNDGDGVAKSGEFSQTRLTMTDKNALRFQIFFSFDDEIKAEDIRRVWVITDKDVPTDRPIDLEKDGGIVVWENN